MSYFSNHPKLLSRLLLILLLMGIAFPGIIFLSSCTTTSNINEYLVSVEQSGVKTPSSFFVLKGNNSENINNIDFNKYSSYLGDSLQKQNWTPSSYSDSKLYLFLEYGTGAFYKT